MPAASLHGYAALHAGMNGAQCSPNKKRGDVLRHPFKMDYQVRVRGFEPPPTCVDMALNHARLPVPPHPQLVR